MGPVLGAMLLRCRKNADLPTPGQPFVGSWEGWCKDPAVARCSGLTFIIETHFKASTDRSPRLPDSVTYATSASVTTTDPGCELRGHFVGHYLSALSFIVANTGGWAMLLHTSHLISKVSAAAFLVKASAQVAATPLRF